VDAGVGQTGSEGRASRPERLRIGIVGAGFVARLHARSARIVGAELVGVASSSPERAAAACPELGAERAFESAAELIGSAEVDVVHICTPNHLHLPLALAAIEAGKHVVCEKPVALDAAGAAELAAAAAAADVVVTVPFVYRFYPSVRELRARLRGAAPRLIHGGYLQDWMLAPDDYNWRVDPELGGASRAFADIGSHWCDLVEFVSGQRIAALIARTAIAHPTRRRSQRSSFERGDPGASEAGTAEAVRTEDIATVLFETDAGASGSVVVSQVSAGRKNRLWVEVSAERETFSFDQESPGSLAILRRAEAAAVPSDFDNLAPEAAAYVTLPAGHPQGYHDCFDAFVADTYAAIAGERREGLPGPAAGLRAARITEAVLDSAERGAWVEVAR
jgi:predicted dehydrogenase